MPHQIDQNAAHHIPVHAVKYLATLALGIQQAGRFEQAQMMAYQ